MRVFELHIRAKDGAWATLKRRPRSRAVEIDMMIGSKTIKRRVPHRDTDAINKVAAEMATTLGGTGDWATNARRYGDAITLMCEG